MEQGYFTTLISVAVVAGAILAPFVSKNFYHTCFISKRALLVGFVVLSLPSVLMFVQLSILTGIPHWLTIFFWIPGSALLLVPVLLFSMVLSWARKQSVRWFFVWVLLILYSVIAFALVQLHFGPKWVPSPM